MVDADENTMPDVAPTMLDTLKAFGLIYNTDSKFFNFFTAPKFRYETVDVVVEQFQTRVLLAAKPAAEAKPKPKPKAAPKQMSITSCLWHQLLNLAVSMRVPSAHVSLSMLGTQV